MKTETCPDNRDISGPSRRSNSSDSVPTSSFERDGEPVSVGQIDDLVFAKLKEIGIKPAHPCSDAVFLRRAYLDVIGCMPTAQEAGRFLEDRSANKRAALGDALLEHDEFADYWALKWSDVLRVKSEFPINLWPMAAQAYHRWIRTCIAQNWPYDKFARALLTASGSNFRDPQVNFFRAMPGKGPREIARTVARVFMGVRTEKWDNRRQDNMAQFFTELAYRSTGEWKEEIVSFDPTKGVATSSAMVAVAPDGVRIPLKPFEDPRIRFCDWLIRPENAWFNRNIVNRIWCWLMGRGIIQEPDDIRPDNPPQNGELLGYLARELVAANYDLKHIYRLILNSQTYQLSAIRRSGDPLAAVNFAHYAIRRLDAEVLIDAIDQVTGTTEVYSSQAPEPYSWIPEDQRSIALADGSITSSFLEMFGRPARDTGLESERSNKITPNQRLHTLNSSHILNKIRSGPALQAIFDMSKSAADVTNRMYLQVLSRLPTDEERANADAYVASPGTNLRDRAADLAWALINSLEFQCRH